MEPDQATPDQGAIAEWRTVSGRHFVATCYEVFLGRDLDALEVADERGLWPVGEVLRSIIDCEEFSEGVLSCLQFEEQFPPHLYQARLTIRHRLWAADELPLSEKGLAAMWEATDWRDFLKTLVEDERLMGEAQLPPVVGLPEQSGALENQFVDSPSEKTHLVILGGRPSGF